MRTENPWAGLASYQDPAVAERKMLFCGRDNESMDLTELIEDNIFVTLYGKSGTGKTSLLHAGVFPLLRKRGFVPVSIRLGMEAKNVSFQSCICSKVLQAVGEQGSVKEMDVVPAQKDEKAQDYLWTWFARRKFLDADGSPVFPVLVFDQFEEVFREQSSQAEVLLRQINFLMDSSHQLPPGTVDGVPYEYDYNFRFLVSLREDDLYHLEDSIDNNFLPEMKHCRFRLRSLTEEGARDVILKPGGDLFGGADKEDIVQTILKVARSSADNSISTNLLSLLCSRIFDDAVQSGASQVSLEQVRQFVGGNPIIKFYQEATAFLSDTEREYLEDNFVDSSGRRDSVSEEQFLRNVKDGTRLLEGRGKILQRTSVSSDAKDYRIELIHDSFCAPLVELRDARLQRNRTRKRATFIGVSVFSIAIILLAGLYMYTNRKSLLRFQEMRTRMITEQARGLVQNDKPYEAIRLLLEVLPRNLSHPDRPVLQETLDVLKRAYGSTQFTFEDSAIDIDGIVASDDWNTIVSYSIDGSVCLWDIVDGYHLPLCASNLKDDSQNSVAISGDGELLATYSHDTLSFWNIRNWKEDGVKERITSFPISHPYIEEKTFSWQERHDSRRLCLDFVPGTYDVVYYGLNDTLLLYRFEEHCLDTIIPVKGEVISKVRMSDKGSSVIIQTESDPVNYYIGEGITASFKAVDNFHPGDFAISHNGNWLAGVFSDKLQIQDLHTGKVQDFNMWALMAYEFNKDDSFLNVITEYGEWITISLSDFTAEEVGKFDYYYYRYYRRDVFLLHPETNRLAMFSMDDSYFEVFSLMMNVVDEKILTSMSAIWDSTWHEEEMKEDDDGNEGINEEVEDNPFQEIVYMESNHDRSLLAIYYKEGAQIWKTQTDSLLFSRVFYPAQALKELHFDPSGNIITLHASGAIKRWRPDMSECIDSFQLAQESDTLTSMSFSPDGSRLYVMGVNGLYTLNGETLDSLSFYPLKNQYYGLQMNHHGNRMVCFSEGDAAVIHVDDPSVMDTLVRGKKDGALYQAVFSEDDKDLTLIDLVSDTLFFYQSATWDCSPVEIDASAWHFTGACEYLNPNCLVIAQGRGIKILNREKGQSWTDAAKTESYDEYEYEREVGRWGNVPTGMVVLPQQNRVIVAYYDGNVYRYNIPLDKVMKKNGEETTFDPLEYQPILDACRERFKKVLLTPEEKKKYYLDL